MNKFLQRQAIKAQIGTKQLLNKTSDVLKNNDGLSHSTEVLIWSLGSAVIVAAVVVLALALFTDEVFPALGDKMKEILNM